MFGREFTRAIEMKQVAQQEAERSKFVVAKAEQIKQANIIRAEGESEAAELISDALANSGRGLIEVRRIDVRKKGAVCLARVDRITVKAISHPGLFAVIMQAAREIAKTLSRSRNVTYLPTSANMLLKL